ncbi:hypothetical protein GO986_03470 [Deinococcus sp. HMF7620]|uniref:VWFD domain-containing protein n=1 Tax=Deinococcus arboris TaxID=2682977 RepID=A0A7C9LS29_9DEIO|nr:VWD domain-containing protein [Deinococcus arboris]MVN85820.1 hypothetical protein [Deinococcus arboris]
MNDPHPPTTVFPSSPRRPLRTLLLTGTCLALTACGLNTPAAPAAQSPAQAAASPRASVAPQGTPAPASPGRPLPGRAAPSLYVTPSAALLTRAGDSAELTVHYFDPARPGAPLPDEVLASLEWANSARGAYTVEPLGKGRVRVTATSAVGSSLIAVRATGPADTVLTAPPVLVATATATKGTQLLSDQQVVFPVGYIPDGADPGNFPLPGIENGLVGGFSVQEVQAALITRPLDGGKVQLVREPVVLRGPAPALGTRLLGQGGATVMGTVRAAETRGEYSLVQLETEAIALYLGKYDLRLDTTRLTAQGWDLARVHQVAAPVGGTSRQARPRPGELCEVSGQLGNGSVQPLELTHDFDFDVYADLMSAEPVMAAKLTAQLGLKSSAEFRGGGSAEVSCELGELDIDLPITGPFAAVLSPSVTLTPSFEASMQLEGGPHLKAEATASVKVIVPVSTDADVAGRHDPDYRRGVQVLPATPTLDWTLEPDFKAWTFEQQAGLYGTGSLNMIVGGQTTRALKRLSGWLNLGGWLDPLLEATKLELVTVKIGPEFKAVYGDDITVAQNRETPTEAGAVLSVETDLKFVRAVSEALSRLGLADLGPFDVLSWRPAELNFYRPVGEGDFEALKNGQPFGGGRVRVGDRLQLGGQATLEDVTGLLAEPGSLVARRGGVWVDGDETFALGADVPNFIVESPGSEDAARLDTQPIEVTQALCDRMGDSGHLMLLSHNRLFGRVPAAGYVGGIDITCRNLLVTLDPPNSRAEGRAGKTVTKTVGLTVKEGGAPAHYDLSWTGASSSAPASGVFESGEGNLGIPLSFTCPQVPEDSVHSASVRAVVSVGGHAETRDATVTFVCKGEAPDGGSTGDPHLETLDGQRYDLQLVGEFVLARTTQSASDFEVQVRTVKEPNGWFYGQVAWNSAYALRVGQNRVNVAGDGALRVNGQGIGAGVPTVTLPGGGRIDRDGARVTVTWPDGTFVRMHGSSVHVRLAAARRGQVTGLLGNANGQDDDFVVQGAGQPLTNPSAHDLHWTFGHSWRVTDATSLFDYTAGQSTATFTDLSFPSQIVTLDGLRGRDPAAFQQAEDRCLGRDTDPATPDVPLPPSALEACVMDVLLTDRDAEVLAHHREEHTPGFSVQPSTATVFVGRSLPLRVQLTGGLNPASITWSADQGTVGADGTYTAPAQPGTYRVRAVSGALTREVTVTVVAADLSFDIRGTDYNWQDTGITLPANTKVRLVAAGTVFVGDHGNWLNWPLGPEGVDRAGWTYDFPADNVQNRFNLVARVTQPGQPKTDKSALTWGYGFTEWTCVPAGGHLWLTHNDTYSLDNSGRYDVKIDQAPCDP